MACLPGMSISSLLYMKEKDKLCKNCIMFLMKIVEVEV